ncbi:hypothetical protein H5410_030194 [Solanum commersonii]|uniref:Uncharacterized protein n=1 Tax=Solanum commersonii TaxID=4109 RepID=A0A9J5YGR6_SOLCO|nr:hypothetical protein H5410_030194 [Solanum commersonii]
MQDIIYENGPLTLSRLAFRNSGTDIRALLKSTATQCSILLYRSLLMICNKLPMLTTKAPFIGFTWIQLSPLIPRTYRPPMSCWKSRVMQDTSQCRRARMVILGFGHGG